MARIAVVGGTGYGGGNVVREAAKRGHEVTSYSRNSPADPIHGVTYSTGSVLDPAFLARSVHNVDVVFDALSPRGELAGELEGVVERLMTLAGDVGVRLGVLGGASSLQVSPGGPLLIDQGEPPPDARAEIQTGIDVLEMLRASREDLDWFYVSPAAGFGAWAPGEATGHYRLSDDVLLVDDNGDSLISGADLALAIVDEIENPAHRRRRFHAAY